MSKSTILSLLGSIALAAVAYFVLGQVLELGPTAILAIGAGTALVAGVIVGAAQHAARIGMLLLTAVLFATPSIVASGALVHRHTAVVHELREEQNRVLLHGFLLIQLNNLQNGKPYLTVETLDQAIAKDEGFAPKEVMLHLREHIDVIGHKDKASGQYRIDMNDIVTYKDRLAAATHHW